jgi:uncharacterized protein YbjT (DUF2867 family)
VTDRIVLVTGSTGHQGGATARRLLADGWRVRALVRDPASPAAAAIAAAGAELAVGDMADRASLDSAMRGVYGVFSVQPAQEAPHFAVDEVGLGRNVADAALAAGAAHIVYSSVGGADRDSGVSHWTTKWEIEQHIRALDLPATILRPVMFMENHASRSFGILSEKALIRMIPPGAAFQVIAVRDIGAFAGLAFAQPDAYIGKALEIAGDEVTREDLIAAVSAATGRTVHAEPLPLEVLASLGVNVDDINRARTFGGWQADIPALRTLHPDLMDLPTWLERDGKARFDALFASASV